MSSVNIHSLPIICKAYGLSVVTGSSDVAQTIVPYDAPFTVQIALAFDDSNSIALLALGPTVQVDFYVKPLQAGSTLDLGSSTLTANGHQSIYTALLEVTSPSELQLMANRVYSLGALVRIGAPDHPALLCGVVEGLMIQIHAIKDSSPEPKKSKKNHRKNVSTKTKK